jgi:hypothetical protein
MKPAPTASAIRPLAGGKPNRRRLDRRTGALFTLGALATIAIGTWWRASAWQRAPTERSSGAEREAFPNRQPDQGDSHVDLLPVRVEATPEDLAHANVDEQLATEREKLDPEASDSIDELDSSAVFESMASDRPDVRAMVAWAENFARSAEVDPDSVVVDAASGQVKGQLLTPDGEGAASFTINGSRYEISMWPPAQGASKEDLPLRSVRWAFENEGGAPSKPLLSLQHHPDTSRPAANFVDVGAERIVGWTFASSDRGSVARPVVVRALAEEPGAWSIGRPETTPGADWPCLFIDNSHKTLLAKLSAHAVAK